MFHVKNEGSYFSIENKKRRALPYLEISLASWKRDSGCWFGFTKGKMLHLFFLASPRREYKEM